MSEDCLTDVHDDDDDASVSSNCSDCFCNNEENLTFLLKVVRDKKNVKAGEELIRYM